MNPSAQLRLIIDAYRQHQQVVVGNGGNFEAHPFGAKLNATYITDPFLVTSRINTFIADQRGQLNQNLLEDCRLLISNQIQQIDTRMDGMFSFIFFLFYWNQRTQLERERRGLVQIQSTLLREINYGRAPPSPSLSSPIHRNTLNISSNLILPPLPGSIPLPPGPPPPPPGPPPPPPTILIHAPLQRSQTITQQLPKIDSTLPPEWPEAPILPAGLRSDSEITACRTYVQNISMNVQKLKAQFDQRKSIKSQQAEIENQISNLSAKSNAIDLNIEENVRKLGLFDRQFEGSTLMVSHQVTLEDGSTNTIQLPMLTRQGFQQVSPLFPKPSEGGHSQKPQSSNAVENVEEDPEPTSSTDISRSVNTSDLLASLSLHFGKTRQRLRESGPPTPMKPKQKEQKTLSLGALVHVLNQDHIVYQIRQSLEKDRTDLQMLRLQLENNRQQLPLLEERMSQIKDDLERQLNANFDDIDGLIIKWETYVTECTSRIEAWTKSKSLRQQAKNRSKQNDTSYSDSEQNEVLQPFNTLIQVLTDKNKSQKGFCKSLQLGQHRVQCRQDLLSSNFSLIHHLTISS